MKTKMTVMTVFMIILLTAGTLLTGQFKEEPFDIGDFSHVRIEEAEEAFEISQTNEDLVFLCKALAWQLEVKQNENVRDKLNQYGQELLDRAKAEAVDLETVDDTEIMLKVLKVIRSTGAK